MAGEFSVIFPRVSFRASQLVTPVLVRAWGASTGSAFVKVLAQVGLGWDLQEDKEQVSER